MKPLTFKSAEEKETYKYEKDVIRVNHEVTCVLVNERQEVCMSAISNCFYGCSKAFAPKGKYRKFLKEWLKLLESKVNDFDDNGNKIK